MPRSGWETIPKTYTVYIKLISVCTSFQTCFWCLTLNTFLCRTHSMCQTRYDWHWPFSLKARLTFVSDGHGLWDQISTATRAHGFFYFHKVRAKSIRLYTVLQLQRELHKKNEIISLSLSVIMEGVEIRDLTQNSGCVSICQIMLICFSMQDMLVGFLKLCLTLYWIWASLHFI